MTTSSKRKPKLADDLELARIVLGPAIGMFLSPVMAQAIGHRIRWYGGHVIECVLKIQKEERG